MNMMIRPILPYYSSITQADGFTVVSMLLLLIGAVFAAFCIAMYAANGQQGEKRKTVLLFMGITAIVTVTMLGFFGCAAVTVRGIILCLAYCVIKIFFANIKRGGILLIQMSVGALYMFSVPRGYQDGFNQWCKQVAAICLTAFMQTTLLYLGLLTFPGNMLLGLGIMLAANEVPRIAQQFGLDSSVRVNMMSVVHATTTAVNLTRSVARAAGK